MARMPTPQEMADELAEVDYDLGEVLRALSGLDDFGDLYEILDRARDRVTGMRRKMPPADMVTPDPIESNTQDLYI